MISNDLGNKMLNDYYLFLNDNLKNKSNIQNAYQTALQRIEVSNLLGFADTTYYYYAGYMAYAKSEIDSSMWKQSRTNLEKAVALDYKEIGDNKGQVYNLLHNACIYMGDSLQALKYAQKGFEMYPNHEGLLYSLINYYLKRGENNKTMEYLEQAVARNPNDTYLLHAQGKVLDELGETEKSHAAYNASIAADPTHFDPHFNKAVLYYNSAVKLNDDAENERVIAVYEAKKEIADEEFAKAIPFLEKAHELKPDDFNTMDILRSLYFRLRTKYPEYDAKYHDMMKKLGKE